MPNQPGITRRFFLNFLLVSILPLAMVGLVYFGLFLMLGNSVSREILVDRTRSARNLTESILREWEGRMENLAGQSPVLVNLELELDQALNGYLNAEFRTLGTDMVEIRDRNQALRSAVKPFHLALSGLPSKPDHLEVISLEQTDWITRCWALTTPQGKNLGTLSAGLSLGTLADRVSKSQGTPVFLRGPKGQVWGQGIKDLKLPGAAQSRTNTEEFFEGLGSTEKGEVLVLFSPLSGSLGGLNLEVGSYYPKDRLEEVRNQGNALLLILLGVMVGVSFYLSSQLSHSITKPIISLASTVQGISRGHYGLQSDLVPSQDEIGDLILDVNQLSRVLKDQIEELRSRTQELERVDRFFHHDLKTPIITIRNFSGAILEDLKAEKYQRLSQDITRIIKSAEFLTRAQDRLALYHDLYQTKSQPRELRIKSLEQKLKGRWTPRFEEAGGTLEFQSSSERALVDAGTLEMILDELLDNVLRFSPQRPHAEVFLQVIDGALSITVQDQGPGINPKILERIGEPYERSQADTTGMGLAIVTRAVKVLGGTMDIRIEKGTLVTLLFPLIPSETRSL